MLKKLFRFCMDDRGGILPFIGISIFALICLTGLAIDSGRAYALKGKLSTALDAASLAGARVLTQGNNTAVQAEVLNLFHANISPTYLGATVPDPSLCFGTFDSNLNCVLDPYFTQLSIRATATLPNSFMQLVGSPSVAVSGMSSASRGKSLELALVIDNTGSMAQNNKFNTVVTAATDLVNDLFGSDSTLGDLYIGLVPFVTAVNVGPSHTSWLTGYSASNFAPTTWGGCVEARAYPFEEQQADKLYTSKPFTPYLWPTTAGQNYVTSGSTNPSIPNNYAVPDDCTDNPWTTSGSSIIPTPTNKTVCTAMGGVPVSSYTQGPNKACPTPITSLVNDKQTILNGINAMMLYENGTFINMGLAWGWRLISPAWQGQWGGATPASLPLPYNSVNHTKAIVLLTDGFNNFNDEMLCPSDASTDGFGVTCGNANSSDYTAYKRRDANVLNLSSNTFANAVSELDNRTAQLCTTIKAQGIVVYTILADTDNEPQSVVTLLSNCATDPSHFFHATDSVSIAAAFSKITAQLRNLRLTK